MAPNEVLSKLGLPNIGTTYKRGERTIWTLTGLNVSPDVVLLEFSVTGTNAVTYKAIDEFKKFVNDGTLKLMGVLG